MRAEVVVQTAKTQARSAGVMAWITAWARESFASDWYHDAAEQGTQGPGRAERRREIVFAVCLAETYLYEWVRDHMAPDDEALLLSLFPNTNRTGIRDRWKEVTKALDGAGKLTSPPNFKRPEWQDFIRLVTFRDGLVHAGASRPVDVRAPSKIDAPYPPAATLDGLAPGWATNVVVREIVELHRLAGTTPETWLVPV
jgi:hypothetical protein